MGARRAFANAAASRCDPPPFRASEQDPCCFHGCGRHDRIRSYNTWVDGVTAGEFKTVVTTGNIHEVNVRDRVIIASLLDKLRIAGELSRADLDTLPFDTMREW